MSWLRAWGHKCSFNNSFEGSQSLLEDSRRGPFPCLLHFSPTGKGRNQCVVSMIWRKKSEISGTNASPWKAGNISQNSIIYYLILQKNLHRDITVQDKFQHFHSGDMEDGQDIFDRLEPRLRIRSKRTRAIHHTSWFWSDPNIAPHSLPIGQRPSSLFLS